LLNGVKIDNRPIRVDLLVSAANIAAQPKQSSLADRVTEVQLRRAYLDKYLQYQTTQEGQAQAANPITMQLTLPERYAARVLVMVAAAASVRRRRPSKSSTLRWLLRWPTTGWGKESPYRELCTQDRLVPCLPQREDGS
jgi:hypothetical protein